MHTDYIFKVFVFGKEEQIFLVVGKGRGIMRGSFFLDGQNNVCSAYRSNRIIMENFMIPQRGE